MKRFVIITLLFLSRFAAEAQVTSFELDSSKFIKPLSKTLDSLYQEDQRPRQQFSEAFQRKASAAETDSLRKIMVQKDRDNLEKAKSILDKYGWLGPQKVGINASQALFLIIQHADLSTQQKYLPLIRNAEKNGEILSSNLAILEDRINMREGKKQLYGSQAVRDRETNQLYFYPIVDPDRLDERRKRMGLSPMAEYAQLMKMEWNVEAYKKALPQLEQTAAKQMLKR